MDFLKASLFCTITLCLFAVSCDWKVIPLVELTIQDRLDGEETPYQIYLDDYTFLDSLYGKTYKGGLIFYFDVNTGKGLISAPEDLGPVLWGCEARFIGSTQTGIGSGEKNTKRIILRCSEPNIAARVCGELEIDNYSDWYLPSRDELNLMHVNLHLNGLGNFSLNRYWSSSEQGSNFAHCQFFNLNTNQLYYDKDLIAYPVRAIRSF